MVDNELRSRRLEVLEEHFRSEIDHDWDACLATFNGHPRYEIMATGQVYDGDDEVLEYHRNQRIAFPDQRHENVRHHFADDVVVAEFDLLGTNLGEFYGMEPTGKSFRVPVVALFFFEGDRITNERIYLDTTSLLAQIGRSEILALAGMGED
ncbi:MAG: ester cyclase [Microthrixaceae bacterium]|nr:ester cyclase [Microthrixaceae bacterium]MCO5322773.1 ester cyclase [Microthrixaceae bacterium]